MKNVRIVAMKRPLFFCSVILLLSLVASPAFASVRHLERDEVTGHIGSTREEILAKRERRKTDFSKKLQELKQTWDDHESGRRRLTEGFETQRLQKKIKAYETKLEHLNAEIDDRVSGGRLLTFSTSQDSVLVGFKSLTNCSLV